MKIPSFFMGKIIVTLFPFTDIPSGMKPSATKSSVLTRHPGSALNSWKVPKMPCFCGFYGVGSNEPVDEPSGFKRRGKIRLYQCRSYYASLFHNMEHIEKPLKNQGFFVFLSFFNVYCPTANISLFPYPRQARTHKRIKNHKPL